MPRIFILFTSLILLYASSASGDEINYQFTSISVEEGLSQSTVQSILLDKKGKLWIGTRNGLNFYTGQDLKIFKSNSKDRYSLPDNEILHLTQDSLNNIWISTRKGLVIYDEKHGNFIPVNQDIMYSSLCISDGILFGSENRIYKYDYKQCSFKSISIKNQEDTGNDITKYRVQKIIAFSEREALVATRRDGVYVLDYQAMRLKRLFSGSNNILQGAYLSSNGYIYLSFWGQGLFCYEKTGKFIKRYTKENSDLTNNYVLDIVEKEGCLWLATDGGGINRLELSNENFSNLCHIAGDENSLPVNSVTLLYQDRNKGLWAGSVRGGVFNIKESHIRTYKDCPLGDINGMSEKSVSCLYEESDGKLWIGTDGGGINLYDSQTGFFKHFQSSYGDKVISIAPVSEKELLVSVYTKGLFLFEKNTGVYRPFTIVNDSINFRQCFYGYLPRAHRVSENKIYILSKDAWVYDISNKKFSAFKACKNYQLPPSLMGYSDAEISLAMSANKIFQITNRNDSIGLLFQIDEKEVITAIDCDGRGKIWVGTTEGMGCYDIKAKRYYKIVSQLFSDIDALRYDPSSERVWICAQNQMFSYCTKDEKFIQWNRSDGFHPNEIIFTYQQRPKKNNPYLYFGGTEGLVQINTDIPDPNEPYLEIVLDGIELNGRPQTSDIDVRNIKIPWKYNTLVLRVYIKNKEIFQRVPFRYIIKGDVDKSIESYNPMLELPNLLPGKYHIEVSCLTKDGDYTIPVHLTDIHVTPPWYKTDWFIILCCIFLAGGIIAVIYILNKRKEIKIQKRLKEYRQYLNEKKIDFLIHINHELRTPLTLIYAPLKRLIDKKEYKESPQYLMSQLQLISNQAQHMREIVDMVLDWNSMEAGYSKLKVQRCKLDGWIADIVKDFTDEAKEKGISIKLQMDTDIEEIWLDRQKCHTVLSNLLMNALKFSMPESCITINTRRLENKVRISVVDEGAGIQDSDMANLFTRFYKGNHKGKGSGFGLYYAKTIMEMHGGGIGAYNNTGRGATFYLELPFLDINEKEEATRLPQKESPIAGTIQDSPFDCSGKTVLVVEDEKELREFLVESLTGTFKKVYAADNAISALETCRKKQPSVIVSDVMMPQMDGFELCRQIKNDIRISHIPVILLTARYDQTGITTGYKSGADSYIPKPFDLESLKTVIGNILKNREKIYNQYATANCSTSLQDSTNSKADEDFMKKINAVIYENLSDEGFSVQQLADAMAVSRSSLYNKIKIITGLGVNDYINRLRIEQAMSLLVNTNLNINEISCEVGFTYPRYFSSAFKNMTGMTPKQFRNENRTRQTTDG